MLRSTGSTPNDFAIGGMAVTITVPSRFSMKNAPATSSEIAVVRGKAMVVFWNGTGRKAAIFKSNFAGAAMIRIE